MAAVNLSINIKAFDYASGAFTKMASRAQASFTKIESSIEAADKAAAKFARTSQMLTVAGIGVAAATVALGLGIKKGADESANLEQSMYNVNSIAKLSADELATLTESVKAVAGDPKVTDKVKELADGLYDIYSSGLSGKDAVDALSVASKGAAAGMTDTATASNVLVAAMNAYGQKSGKDAVHFMDVMFKTVERGVVTFPQLAGSLGNVMGTAAQVGVTIEELGAGISTMTKQGIGAEESITSLNGILMQMLSPNEKLRKIMKDSGYESGLAILQTRGLAGAMQWLSDATGNNAAVMADALGDVRAVRGAMALTGAGTKMFADDLEGMAGAAGSAGAALDEQSKGPVFRARVAMKEINGLVIAFGASWSRAFSAVAPLISKFVAGLKKFLESGFGSGFTFMATVVALVTLALAGSIIMLGQAVIAWQALSAAMVANAEAAATAAAANTTAGAASAGGGLLGGLGRLAGGARGLASAAMRFIGPAIASITAFMAPLITAAIGAIMPVLAVVGEVFVAIAAAVAAVPIGTILAVVAGLVAMGAAVFNIAAHWDKVKAFFADLPNALGLMAGSIVGFIQYSFGYLVGFLQGLPGAIGQALVDAYHAIIQWTVDSYNALITWFANLPAMAAEGFAALVQSIQDGLASAWQSVQEFFGMIYNELKNLPANMYNGAKAAVASFFAGFTTGKGNNSVSAGYDAGRAAFGGARAGGGFVSAGQMYTVNENGVEHFIPQTNGYIMPAGAAGASGGGTVTLRILGDALDARILQVVGSQNVKVVRGFN